MVKNKRGFKTVTLIVLIFVAFMLAIITGIISFFAQQTSETLDQLDFNLGNQSFNETYADTLRPALVSLQTTFPATLGLGVMLGMIIVLLLVGYYAPEVNRAWLILDIFIILLAFALAIIISDSFTTYMNSYNPILLVYADQLPYVAKFILNLKKIIPVVGGLIILVTYGIRKQEKTQQQEGEVLGY